jgi:hypothetical protein
MSNESLKQPMMQPDRESSVESTNANQRIEQLPEETRELSDEQAQAIAGGRSRPEKPSFDLLESMQGVLPKLSPRNLSH